MTSITQFLTDEAGAVTVDFVILCAAATLLAVGTIQMIANDVAKEAEDLGGIVDNAVVQASSSI